MVLITEVGVIRSGLGDTLPRNLHFVHLVLEHRTQINYVRILRAIQSVTLDQARIAANVLGAILRLV